MDVFYEESALPRDGKKGKIKYNIFNGISIFFLICAILSLFSVLMIDLSQNILPQILFVGAMTLTNGVAWFGLFRFKQRFNLSYDYCFVTGDLRIAKVINGRKRKLVARFDAENIIQMGDVDSPAYERFKSDPSVKTIICTPNEETSEDKFFMYIYAEYQGKKLFILECREELLIHIMKFAKRGTLDHDYVSQEKKKLQQQKA